MYPREVEDCAVFVAALDAIGANPWTETASRAMEMALANMMIGVWRFGAINRRSRCGGYGWKPRRIEVKAGACVFDTEYLTVCEGKDRIIMSPRAAAGFEVEDGSRSAYAFVRVRTPASAWSGRRHRNRLVAPMAQFANWLIDWLIGCSR